MTPRFSPNFWSSGPEQSNFTVLRDTDPLRTSVVPGEGPWHSGNAWTLQFGGKALGLFVPEHYEPSYPYPLILWLHGAGGSERELPELMPRISTRNYIGAAFRGPLRAENRGSGGFRWSLSEKGLSDFEDELYAAVCRLRREYHIHSERIIPAGFDEGATVALQLMLDRPEWFGGAIALGGRLPRARTPLSRFGDLQGKRVLLTAGSRDATFPIDGLFRASRLLHSAGMDVTTRVYNAGHELTPKMLTHVNQWVMDGICQPV